MVNAQQELYKKVFMSFARRAKPICLIYKQLLFKTKATTKKNASKGAIADCRKTYSSSVLSQNESLPFSVLKKNFKQDRAPQKHYKNLLGCRAVPHDLFAT